MWWRLCHRLFGWHYVQIIDCGDLETHRVKRLPDGRLCGKTLGKAFFIYPDGEIRGGFRISDWWPLTWEYRTYAEAVKAAELASPERTDEGSP